MICCELRSLQTTLEMGMLIGKYLSEAANAPLTLKMGHRLGGTLPWGSKSMPQNVKACKA